MGSASLSICSRRDWFIRRPRHLRCCSISAPQDQREGDGEPASRDEFYRKLLSKAGADTSFYLFGWRPGSLDALNVLTNLLACPDVNAGRGRYNIGGYCSSVVDGLVDQARSEADANKRDALILRAFQAVHQDVPVVPLHQQISLKALAKTLAATDRRDGWIVLEEFMKVP